MAETWLNFFNLFADTSQQLPLPMATFSFYLNPDLQFQSQM